MDDVTQAIIAGGLGDDAITLENRVQIAKHFVTQLEDGVSKIFEPEHCPPLLPILPLLGYLGVLHQY